MIRHLLLFITFTGSVWAQQGPREAVDAINVWKDHPLKILDQTKNPNECPNGAVSTPRLVRGGMPLKEAILSAVEEMKQIKPKLHYTARGGTASQVFNPDFWEPMTDPDPDTGVVEPGSYKVRRGVSPWQAVEDIFMNPDKYRIECATATKFIYYRAFIKNVGSSRFDKAIHDRKGLIIRPRQYEGLLKEVMKRETESDKPANRFPGMAAPDIVSVLSPGDAVYMINLNPTAGASRAGLGGENLVYIGNNEFYADGISEDKAIVTTEEVQSTLKKYWDPTPGIATAKGAHLAGQENVEPWFVDEYYHPDEKILDRLGKD